MPAPPPTARLLRAVAAERDELDRHRVRMTEEAAELRRALGRIERGIVEIDERRALLDRLTAEPDTRDAVARRDRARARVPAGTRSDAVTRGDAGMRSDTGARGDAEARGNTGERDDAGVCGDAGMRGDAEARGNTGEPGDAGVRGDADARGNTGKRGDAGVRGNTGLRSDADGRGDAGVRGNIGLRSDADGRGDAGVRGNIGLRSDADGRGDADGRSDAGVRGDAEVRGNTEVRSEAVEEDGLLRGPEIREVAVRVLLERGGEAMHYRDWYELVEERGLLVAGKDPLAVFLTQLGRSPAVRRGMEAGVYELDRHAGARHRAKLETLQRELRELTMTAGGDPGAIRARRQQLSVEIGRVERSLEEIARVLGPAPPLAAAG